jgi:hypothetical protein
VSAGIALFFEQDLRVGDGNGFVVDVDDFGAAGLELSAIECMWPMVGIPAPRSMNWRTPRRMR